MCLFSSFAWPLMIFSACRKPWSKQCLYFSNCGHEMAGTKKAEYRFANKNCRLYCNTDLPWKMPCFKIQRTRWSPIRFITLPNSDRGYSSKCYTMRVRLCPEVQPLTLCYTLFDRKKDPKGLADAFYGCQRVVKRSGFVIYSYWKDSAFTAVKLKGMQSSKLGMWMGYRLSIEGLRKGYTCYVKNGM